MRVPIKYREIPDHAQNARTDTKLAARESVEADSSLIKRTPGTPSAPKLVSRIPRSRSEVCRLQHPTCCERGKSNTTWRFTGAVSWISLKHWIFSSLFKTSRCSPNWSRSEVTSLHVLYYQMTSGCIHFRICNRISECITINNKKRFYHLV